MSQASEQPQTVAVPRAYLDAAGALDLVGRRAGQTYVVVTRDLEGLVGPFAIGQEIAVRELLAMVAKATGTELSAAGAVPVFQHERTEELERALSDVTAGDVQKRRCAAFALGESQRLEAVAANRLAPVQDAASRPRLVGGRLLRGPVARTAVRVRAAGRNAAR